MTASHDQSSVSLDEPSGSDVLSSVLDAVRLTGALFFLVDAAPPWFSKAPPARDFAPLVLPRSEHLISYHVVTSGSCWAGLTGEAPERLDPGDALVVPHGDSYFLADDPSIDAVSGAAVEVEFFRRMAAGELPPRVDDTSGREGTTHFICGFLGCAHAPANLLLAALPRVLHVRRGSGPGDAMEHLVTLALSELRQRRAGNHSVLLRLSELMFVEVLRRHVEAVEAAPDAPARGWISGLRDPLVARMLAALHGEPARAWTLDSLAGRAGASRTVAAERFAATVGQPPMQYLTRWRMQLAIGLLSDPANKVVSVAEATGYGSEAAFSRAFKKALGVSPAAFRAR